MATDKIVKHIDDIFVHLSDIREELVGRIKASDHMTNFNPRLSSISIDKSQEDEFYAKIEFLAKLLYFKKQYDADYKPDWFDELAPKYYVWYNSVNHCYCYGINYSNQHIGDVYFSSFKVAEKCIDWLNKFN